MRLQMKKIICTTDFSDPSYYAIPYGIALAKEYDAKLYVCHVIDLSSLALYGDAVLDFDAEQKRNTEYAYGHIKERIGQQAVDWEPLVLIGNVPGEIALLARERSVDLVVSATHGRSGLKRFLLGSVTERLMRTLSCPLLVVRSPEQDLESFLKKEPRLQRILVGCDFSPDSDLAFRYGLSFAQEFQSELHLVHVIEPPAYKNLLKSAAEAGEQVREDLRQPLNERLAAMVPKEAMNWCAPKTTLLAGEPHEELIKYAAIHDIDLIVLGVRGHSLVETLFVGSTTDRVVRQATCPVLAVRPVVQAA